MKLLLSILNNLIMSFRNLLYDNKILSIKTLSIPIISVGNIELGGTGKTPIVLYLSNLLLKNGFKPGIISRGYKRNSFGRQIVSNGEKILLNPLVAGDEPFFLASSLKNVPIVVDKNRVSSSKYMIDNFDVNIIILDDAFQHRQINRTIDIVLLNINTPINQLKPFPLGFLREKITNVFRADILLITKQNQFTNAANLKFCNNLYFHNKFITISKFLLINPITNKRLNIKKGINNAFVFCGIGDPDYFKNTILSLNINISIFKSYRDHQNYNDSILNEIEKLISNKNIKTIITTEKDYVKLPFGFCEKFSIIILRMNFVLNEAFDNLILKML